MVLRPSTDPQKPACEAAKFGGPKDCMGMPRPGVSDSFEGEHEKSWLPFMYVVSGPLVEV